MVEVVDSAIDRQCEVVLITVSQEQGQVSNMETAEDINVCIYDSVLSGKAPCLVQTEQSSNVRLHC